jgi:hypothetical protein
MTLTITHSVVATDPQDPLLGATEWNDVHSISGTIDQSQNNVAVDGVTITGDGTPGNPLVAVIPADAVTSVNGQTGVVVLDTGDVDPVTNRNYVTDANLTVINNTSGTNTGDQTDVTGNAGTVTTINGRLAAGTGTSLTGSGTAGSPYAVNSLLALTTTGSSGASTYNPATGELNIPQYVAGTGTVETVDIASANGFAGTSDGDPTDPVLTVSTTVTGIVKGNGTALSAASPGTDYVTADSTNTFTNKTFDADGTGNSITNIENADIKAAAAIALNKLAATTVSRALVSDGSGFVSPSATTATEIGYVNGVTSAIQTQINSKQATIPFGTGVQTALGVNIGSAGAPVLFNGALGTPSSGTATNLTGTAAGLTAGTVTTNANLTGAVTSSGNATSLGSFSSADLRGALTDESGTGAAIFAGGNIGAGSATTAAVTDDSTLIATTAFVKDWVTTTSSNYSPVLKGFNNGSTYTNQTTTGHWRRNGDYMEGTISADFTGTPGTGTGVFVFMLPASTVVDTAKMTNTAGAAANVVGAGLFFDGSTGTYYVGTVGYAPAASGGAGLTVQIHGQTSGASPSVPVTVDGSDFLSFNFALPCSTFP